MRSSITVPIIKSIGILAAATAVTLWVVVFLGGARMKTAHKGHQLTCRNNLRQLAVAMHMYAEVHGGGRYLPYVEDQQNGAEFLAMLYWSDILDEPKVFVCSSSPDGNEDGLLLGRSRDDPDRATGDDWKSAVSFASRLVGPGEPALVVEGTAGVSKEDEERMNTVLGRKPLPIMAMPGSTVLACDDTEGPPHHEGINVVFFDTHAEFLRDLNPNEGAAGSVGRQKPVDVLRN